MNRILLIFLLALAGCWLAAQEGPVSETIAILSEELAEDEEDPSSTENMLQC